MLVFCVTLFKTETHYRFVVLLPVDVRALRKNQNDTKVNRIEWK